MKTRIDFPSLNRRLLGTCPTFLKDLLPGGRVEGHEYVALNPLRQDKHLGSFRVNMKTGRWADFATTDKGRDLISLYAYLKSLTQYQAALVLSQQTGGHYDRSGEARAFLSCSYSPCANRCASLWF